MRKTSIPSEKEAFQKVAALCSQRECCVSQILEKLQAWGVDMETAERIVERLQEERFIDESRFCRAYALDKLRYNHWGRVKIDQMLRMMGLPAADRRAALDELPVDEYRDVALRLIQSKFSTIRSASDYEKKGKLVRYMVGKGFETSLVFQLLDFSPED